MKTMKESGIQWIGAIPESWNTKRIKYMATLKGRIGWQGLTSEEYQDEGAYLITGVDFDNGGIDWENCVHVPMKRWEEAKDIQIQDGDLLITKDGTIGKVAIVSDMPGETSLNSGVLRIMPIEGYSRRFLYWVIKSDEFWSWFNFRNAGNSTIIHLYQGDFAEFLYAFPSYEEQEAIADYLDEHCGKLDCIIADLKKQIETLNGYKKSLITESVTEGLDKTVPMRDSGIEWIGNIPKHWETNRILYLLEQPITDGPHTTPEMQDSGIPFVSAEAVSCGNGRIDFDHIWGYISEEFYKECCRKYTPRRDDIYMIKSGATTGRVAIVDTDEIFTIWSPLAVFRCNKELMLPKFMFYSLQADFFQMQVQLGWTYGTQQNIGMRTLEHLKICVPPIDEQIKISTYLDEVITQIDELSENKQKQLDAMNKHKASLIFEYVTGKKQVKEVQ